MNNVWTNEVSLLNILPTNRMGLGVFWCSPFSMCSSRRHAGGLGAGREHFEVTKHHEWEYFSFCGIRNVEYTEYTFKTFSCCHHFKACKTAMKLSSGFRSDFSYLSSLKYFRIKYSESRGYFSGVQRRNCHFRRIPSLQKANWKSRHHPGKHSRCSTEISEQREQRGDKLLTQSRSERQVHEQSSNHSLLKSK